MKKRNINRERKHKGRVGILLLAALLISGCSSRSTGSGDDDTMLPTATREETVAVEAAAEDGAAEDTAADNGAAEDTAAEEPWTVTVVPEILTVEPEHGHDVGTPLNQEELARYQVLFDDYSTWYSQALTSLYADPTQVDLGQLFYGQMPGVDNTLTAEEKAFMNMALGTTEHELDILKLPADEMDRVLQQYFGITLEETQGIGLERFFYFDKTDCYYHYVSDFNGMRVSLHSGYRLADGSIRLHYQGEASPLYGDFSYAVTVRPTEQGLQILSNCLDYDVTSDDDAAEFPRTAGDLVSHRIATYFTERAEYLYGYSQEAFSGADASVFVQAERHRSFLQSNGLVYRLTGMEGLEIRFHEKGATVTVTEQMRIFRDGERTDGTVSHVIELVCREGEAMRIVSDTYREEITGFASDALPEEA